MVRPSEGGNTPIIIESWNELHRMASLPRGAEEEASGGLRFAWKEAFPCVGG
jgi:hypothetical protein